MPPRQFSPLELNQLQKYGFGGSVLATIGEKPVEYVTGHAEFCGLDFLVNESTLIPRLESERIVQMAFDHLTRLEISHPIIADVGTGSGCLAISLAAKLVKINLPYTIYLSDISPEALAVSEQNAARLLPSTVNLFFEPSDLFENYPQVHFDLVMANLPYISSESIASLSPSIKDFEPRSALDGGPEGNFYLNRLLDSLPNFLSKQGLAILEINDTHSVSSFTLPKEIDSQIASDLYGVPRFLIVHLKD